MSSNPQRIQQHLENRGSGSEALVFDPATGKLMVKSQQEAQNSDRTVMLDMNKSGSGGFFNCIRLPLATKNHQRLCFVFLNYDNEEGKSIFGTISGLVNNG